MNKFTVDKAFIIIKTYWWLAVLPLFIYGVISSITSKHDINQNQTDTFGEVQSSSPILRQPSKRSYKYTFIFKNKTYSGTSAEYLSKRIAIGDFYKVEFSNKNPEHSRMLFNVEYIQDFKYDNFGKVTDTIYIEKNHELKQRMNDLMEQAEFKTNTTIDSLTK